MRGPDTGEASGFGFDHRLEVVPAGAALLLKVDSDGFQVVIRQGLVQQRAISLGACLDGGIERNVCRVG